MRRKFTIFILSLFLIAGGAEAFADGRNDNRGGKGRQEQTSKHSGRNNSGNRNNGNHNGNRPGSVSNKNTKDNKGHNFDKNHKPGGNHGNFKPGGNKPGGHNPGGNRPGGNNHGGNSYRPGHGSVPPPPPAPVMRPGHGAAYHTGPALPPPPPRLPYMVRNLTRGCNDVAVWQVNPQTFAVRYSMGGRLYIQYVYPYSNLYGEPNVISVNWQPLSPWTLIPPIQLNINL